MSGAAAELTGTALRRAPRMTAMELQDIFGLLGMCVLSAAAYGLACWVGCLL
jgi:hypothetical protein